MNVFEKWRKRRNGSSLLTITILVAIASAFAATSVGVSLSRTFMAKKLAERIKAVAIAEAGVSEAYSILVKDFSQRTNAAAFPLTGYADGHYDVAVSAISSNGASVCSTGVYGSVSEVVILDLMKTPGQAPYTSDPVAFDYAILAGGEIDWTGSSMFHSTNVAVHSNGGFTRSGSGYLNADVSSSTAFRSNGSAGGIDGDVRAPSLSGKLSSISGTTSEEAVPLVEFPDIDLTPYYNEALANGEVINGSASFSSSYAPDGGILWVNGDLGLSGNNAQYDGCFIATGDISVSGGGAIRKVNNYPVMVSRDGNIHFTGHKDLEGLVYVKMGDYQQQAGNNALNGQYMVRGDFSKGGSSGTDIFFAEQIIVPPGGSTEGSDGSLAVTAWQQ